MRAALLVPILVIGCSGPMPALTDGGFLLPIPTGSGGGGFGGGLPTMTGGGTTTMDAGVMSSARGVCTGTVVFPADVGRSCGAGSNQALCVVSSQSTCGAETVCVWDAAAPTTARAYCTVGCTVGDSTSCPSGYDCLQQGCSNGPQAVCARRTTSRCTRIPEFATGRIVVSTLMAPLDATAVGVLEGTSLRVFLMRGVTVVRDLGSVPDSRFAARSLGSFGPVAWWSAPPRLVRITDAAVESFSLPNLSEYELAATAGATTSFVGVAPTTRNSVIATFQAGAFSGGEATATVVNRFNAGSLASGAVVGECSATRSRSSLCVTIDFVTATMVALPAGASMPERDWSISGASPVDFAVVTDDAAVLRYRDGQWVSDTFPAGDSRAFLRAVGTERYLVRQGFADGGAAPSALYLETPTCWRRLQSGASVYVDSVPARHGYYSSGTQWCDVPLPR